MDALQPGRGNLYGRVDLRIWATSGQAVRAALFWEVWARASLHDIFKLSPELMQFG